METLNLALLGGGTVGSAFYTLVQERQEELAALGFLPRFLGVLVRDKAKPRAIPPELLRVEPFDLLEADVVVEALGGVEAPLKLVLPALEAGIPLITANKALLAEAWDALRPFAEEGLIYHEASVMAGTPALSFLETLRGSQVLELHGILNGTTLYILQEMEKGRTYAEALAEAQRLGYAEADPTLDVEGIDAAHKLTLLARLLVDPGFPFAEVRAQGIARLTPDHLEEAGRRGARVRLVASLYGEGGRWRAEVAPRYLPQDHPLAQARGNALWVRAHPLGEAFVTGPGAGGGATASGLFADLLRLLSGAPGHLPAPRAKPPLAEGHPFPEVLTQ
ncbi:MULTISPECIES: homoserine dehydrogenase [Thermus]|jgi:homoserine dehydrogenase|uniref:Homoserine dehydrogenase n=1 Tax=Thermus brockianus TaxID=56956 RepID=A0ABN6NGF7_THEBO|nr:homoserine dehydrogenase [Thermus brockianus]BDG16712.1 homoserine dehydrogenase [Thermus brockianus]